MKLSHIIKLYKYGKQLGKKYNTMFELVFSHSVDKNTYGDSNTTVSADGKHSKRRVRIFLRNYSIKSFGDELTAFTAAIVCINHEYKHYLQFDAIQCGTESMDITTSFLISKYNYSYYLSVHDQLFFEIDAEAFGLFQAFEFLKKEFGEKTATTSIKKYIQQKRSMVSFYQKICFENCDGIESIIAAIDEYKHDLENRPFDIEFFSPRIEAENEEMYFILKLLKTKKEQAKFLSACTFHIKPEYHLLCSNHKISKIDYSKYKNAYKKLIDEKYIEFPRIKENASDVFLELI